MLKNFVAIVTERLHYVWLNNSYGTQGFKILMPWGPCTMIQVNGKPTSPLNIVGVVKVYNGSQRARTKLLDQCHIFFI